MALKTIDLYLVQAPGTASSSAHSADADPDDYLWNMLAALPASVPVKDIQDFINKVLMEFAVRRRPIRNLVVASHGGGYVGFQGREYFELHIGGTTITADPDDKDSIANLNLLVALRPVFAPDAHVYLLTCNVGHCHKMLRRISLLLGGVPVHGFESFVTATDYLLFKTANDETDDDSTEVICWPHDCKSIAAGEDRDRTWEPLYPFPVSRK